MYSVGADGVVVISACSVVSRSRQEILFSCSRVRAPHPPESNTLDTFRVLPLPMSESRETQPPFRNMIKPRGYPPSKITPNPISHYHSEHWFETLPVIFRIRLGNGVVCRKAAAWLGPRCKQNGVVIQAHHGPAHRPRIN
ncbi:hypothetical protein ARMSODRAFT_57584 [Armillaria solidipes]|uniref:Uncharacterized protein n=1 Tax=Armillaria solidipes TaxID=1076256 RepID=A0A2H3CKD1_9AGAR|nr:hypothetical protein ARMSODRAFT_57584 [Armillaria solidipes]